MWEQMYYLCQRSELKEADLRGKTSSCSVEWSCKNNHVRSPSFYVRLFEYSLVIHNHGHILRLTTDTLLAVYHESYDICKFSVSWFFWVLINWKFINLWDCQMKTVFSGLWIGDIVNLQKRYWDLWIHDAVNLQEKLSTRFMNWRYSKFVKISKLKTSRIKSLSQ